MLHNFEHIGKQKLKHNVSIIIMGEVLSISYRQKI